MTVAPPYTAEHEEFYAALSILKQLRECAETGTALPLKSQRLFQHFRFALEHASDPTVFSGQQKRFQELLGEAAATRTVKVLKPFFDAYWTASYAAGKFLPITFESDEEKRELKELLHELLVAVNANRRGFAPWPFHSTGFR